MNTATWTPIANTVAWTAHPGRPVSEVIEVLHGQGFVLCKYADDLEPAREGMTLEDALAIAAEDPTLIAAAIADALARQADRDDWEMAMEMHDAADAAALWESLGIASES